jgi:hypothetical protein
MALTQIQQDGLSANAITAVHATIIGGTPTINAAGQPVLVIAEATETLSPFLLAGM